MEAATRQALAEMSALDRPLGAAAVVLARRVDNPGMDTGSAIAAVTRQLEATLSAATRTSVSATAPGKLQDELAARRATRGGGA